jgi:hypothetical protein
MRSVRRLWLGLALSGALVEGAGAQQRRPPTYGEFRIDVIAGSGTAVHGGAGIVIPLGVYTRASIDAAAGARWRDDAVRASGRVDVIARFLLDPFREVPAGLSLGGGLTVPYTEGDATVRPYITAVIDVEGRMWRRLTPALQLGLGGGTRVGLVFRASPRGWR